MVGSALGAPGGTSTSRRWFATNVGEVLPEVTMAVAEDARGCGIGGRLLDELAAEAAGRFSALSLNVHMRNPAARLYMRNGFRVAGKGRGWYGVAMVRSLEGSS